MVNNINTLEGTIYSIIEKSGKNKKEGLPDWRLWIVKVEVDAMVKGSTKKAIIEFSSDWNTSFDGFYEKDNITFDYYFVNRKVPKKDGTIWEKEEKKICFVEHSDIQRGDNKISVSAMSDIDKIGEPPEDDPFPEVKTNMVKPKIDVDDDDSDGLPF